MTANYGTGSPFRLDHFLRMGDGNPLNQSSVQIVLPPGSPSLVQGKLAHVEGFVGHMVGPSSTRIRLHLTNVTYEEESTGDSSQSFVVTSDMPTTFKAAYYIVSDCNGPPVTVQQVQDSIYSDQKSMSAKTLLEGCSFNKMAVDLANVGIFDVNICKYIYRVCP